jgi:signal transduction histidine kinase
VRELLVLASEELRGPLTSVSGYLQVLMDGEVGELGAGQRRVAAIAARNAERMERLVDDLIVVAQLRAGAPGSDPLDLGALVRDRVRSAAGAAEARGVLLGAGSEPCPPVAGDVISLGQAVDYLLEHAIGFSVPGGAVEALACAAGPGEVAVEIRDEGIPLEPAEVADLFAGRTAPANAGPRRMLGSRLGLYLVRMVAEAHGGRAEAERADDGGTRLRMVLPAMAC